MSEQSTPTLGTPLPPPRSWRLVRARNDKLSGVCAGLATAAGVDVTLVRLAFIAAGLSGFGIVVYIVLTLVVPKENPAQGDVLQAAPPNVSQWIRIALGVGAVLGVFGAIDGGPPFLDGHDGFGFGFGVLLCLVGAAIMYARRRHPLEQAASTPPPPPPSPTWSQPVAPAAAPVFVEPSPYTPPAAEPATGFVDPMPPPTTVLPHVPAPPPPMPVDPSKKTSGAAIVARVFGWLTVIGTIPVAIAVGALVKVKAISMPVPFLFLALAIVVVVNLIVWSSIGRRAPLIVGAMILVPVFASVVALASHWNGEIGERAERPATRAELQSPYRLAIGHEALDLSQLRVTGDPVRITAETRVGLLEIVVPDDATVAVEADVTGGVIDLFGVERDGMTISMSKTDGTSERSRIELDASVGFGRLEVCRAAEAELTDGTLRCVGTGS